MEDLSKLKDEDECIKTAVNDNADITKKLSVMQKNLSNQWIKKKTLQTEESLEKPPTELDEHDEKENKKAVENVEIEHTVTSDCDKKEFTMARVTQQSLYLWKWTLHLW